MTRTPHRHSGRGLFATTAGAQAFFGKRPRLNAASWGDAPAPVPVDPVPDYVYKWKPGSTDLDTGSYVTAAQYRDGVFGPNGVSLYNNRFNGSSNDAYRDNSRSADFAAGTGAISYSFWIRANPIALDRSIFGTGQLDIRLRNTGKVRVFGVGGGTFETTSDIDDGLYHLITVTAPNGTGGTARLYVDGVEEDTITTSYNFTDTGTFSIGERPGINAWIEADVDYFLFYDRDLTPAEIALIYNERNDFRATDISTIVDYDTEQRLTITDAAGVVSQIDQIPTNTYPLTQAVVANQPTTGVRDNEIINVVDYDGNDYVLASSVDFPSTGTFALVFVCEIDSVTNLNQSIIATDDGTTGDFFLRAGNATQFDGQFVPRGLGMATFNLTGGPFTGVNVWAIVFNRDISTVSVYVNDTLVGSNAGYTINHSTLADLIVMANRAKSEQIDGSFGDLTIVNTASEGLRQKLTAEKAWKNGVQSKLDASNPDKAAPPKKLEFIALQDDEGNDQEDDEGNVLGSYVIP